jgi:hypothetical protein
MSRSFSVCTLTIRGLAILVRALANSVFEVPMNKSGQDQVWQSPVCHFL